jgi:polyisoprenyl-teichoic acid--peptidoglycan teichoic acid transferase
LIHLVNDKKMQSTSSETTQSSVPQWLKIALVAAFIIAVALTAYLTFVAVRDFTASWQLTSLPGITIQEATPTPDASGKVANVTAPLQSSEGPVAPTWNGASRVTVLIMGLDFRDWQAGNGAPRTDTMILLTIDPLSHSAGMLSIPRDMWVNIPGGFKYGRINTAYALGESFKYPKGGGPGLAMATVEELIGVPIDYYAQIDFGTFVTFIDEIGGVKVDVPEKMTIDPEGANNTYRLKKGMQTLPGELALAYARARHTAGGDFDRAKRQQQVIMGIREKMLTMNMFPTMIARAPALYKQLSSGIHTNMNLDEAIKLAWLASQIPQDKIKQGIIGPPNQVTFAQSPDGSQQVLKPITEKIRLLRDEIFTDTGPVSPVAASANPVDLMKAEVARVGVNNASQTSGIAARTGDYLKAQGVNVIDTGNGNQPSSVTTITFYNGKPYTVSYLVSLMKVDKNHIHAVIDPTSKVDVLITLGDDWANTNPMPAQ